MFLSKEIKVFVELVKREWNVSFITYGNDSDLKLGKQHNGIDIYCNNLGLPFKMVRNIFSLIK